MHQVVKELNTSEAFCGDFCNRAALAWSSLVFVFLSFARGGLQFLTADSLTPYPVMQFSTENVLYFFAVIWVGKLCIYNTQYAVFLT